MSKFRTEDSSRLGRNVCLFHESIDPFPHFDNITGPSPGPPMAHQFGSTRYRLVVTLITSL
jgi:hypothetical protein